MDRLIDLIYIVAIVVAYAIGHRQGRGIKTLLPLKEKVKDLIPKKKCKVIYHTEADEARIERELNGADKKTDWFKESKKK